MPEQGDKTLTIKVGVCETCRYLCVDIYDPSPPGVALGPGHMEDISCAHPDADNPEWDEAWGIDKECPRWEPRVTWCKRHERWFIDECPDCLEDMAREFEEMAQLNLR